MTTEVERNIKSLICENKGELSLSTIKDDYLFRFHAALDVPQYAKLSSWIDSFPSFGLRKKRGTNDTIVYLKEGVATSHDVNNAVVNNIKQLLNSNGGELSMSWLKEDYMKMFHEPFPRGNGKLSSWLKNVSCFGMKVRPNTNDSILYLKQPISLLSERLQDLNIENEGDRGVYSDVVEEIKVDEIIESLLAHAGGSFQIPSVHQEVQSILNILPGRWTEVLKSIGVDKVTDISLDIDRRPHCWIDGKRMYIAKEDDSVNVDDIECIVQTLKEIGSDNRAGFDKQLHRVSAIRNNNDAIIGLTIRIGRHVEGNADFLLDLLYDNNGSILLLGEPGSGKTTIVREITSKLAEDQNVFVIDTSNEIAGNGDIPHLCIGNARRMMVKSLQSQAKTMIECVQNHTPHAMVIDEIGRKEEVRAAQTSKDRGVRMIASAHGDLRKLVNNVELKGLVGGTESVTLGDEEARKRGSKSTTNGLQKQMTVRAGKPIFDIIIELKRGKLNEWNVICNVGKAVDDILNGHQYTVQKRMRCMNSGRIFVEKQKH